MLHAVTYTYADQPDKLDELRPDHRRFLQALCDLGVVVASGPTPPHGDLPAGALLLLDTSDADEAGRVLDDDPFAVAELIAQRTIRPWSVVIGSVGR